MEGVSYKIVFDKDTRFCSYHGQFFSFKKDVPKNIPHWEIDQAKKRGAKVLQMNATPEQKINSFYGGFDNVA